VNGGRFDSDLSVVLFHLVDYLAFGAGDALWNEVVDVEIREGLVDSLRIELTITQHRLYRDVFFRSCHQSPYCTVNLVR
jgi:hypothetical protein